MQPNSLKPAIPQDRDRYLGRWIARIYRATHYFMAERLRDEHVGYGQFPFLTFVCRNEGVCQETIARELYYDKGTTARAVQKLEKLKLVRRHVCPEDRRKNLLFITAAGRRVVARIELLLAEWQEVLAQGFSPAEVAAVRGDLMRIATNAREFVEHSRKCRGLAKGET